MRGRAGSLAASPTLVGAVTVLVVVVTVFLSYQANQGLPFVPTYNVSATLPNANTLVPGNEVRIGGIRVGQIKTIQPVTVETTDEEGEQVVTTAAKVNMELQEDLDPLPEDTQLIVRSRSALGLKYLDIKRGESEEGYGPGATIPITQARPEPVELDEVFNTFDTETRVAIQANLTEFGNALAGRGVSLNAALGDLRPLVRRLEPVMRNLASRSTGLDGFVRGLSQAAAEVAPVAEIQGQLFVDLETTFGALADVSRPYIQDFISKSPPTLDTTIRTLPRIRPFIRNTTGLFADLRPGFAAIRPPVSRDIQQGVSIGVKALRQSPAFNNQLPPTAQSLLNFSNDASSRAGVDYLTQFNGELGPPLSFITPAQSVCNYASLLFRNSASFMTIGNAVGKNQRFIVLGADDGPNSEIGPSASPANGGAGSSGPANFLHYNPYPFTAAPGQPRSCEAGNENYIAGQAQIGNTPGPRTILTDEQTDEQKGTTKKKKKKN